MDALDTRSAVIERFERYVSSSGISERQFGLDAVGDHKFFKRLRDGAGVTLKVIEKAERWMADHPLQATTAPAARQTSMRATSQEDAA